MLDVAIWQKSLPTSGQQTGRRYKIMEMGPACHVVSLSPPRICCYRITLPSNKSNSYQQQCHPLVRHHLSN